MKTNQTKTTKALDLVGEFIFRAGSLIATVVVLEVGYAILKSILGY